MTYTLRLPFADTDGTLSPLVDEALKHGATANRGPINGTETFDLTFKTKKAMEAFSAKFSGEAVEAQDPVDDQSAVEVVEPTSE